MGLFRGCRDSLNFELCSLKFELVTCARMRQQGEPSIKTMTYKPRRRAAGLRTLLANQRFLTTIVPQNVTTGIQSRVNPGADLICPPRPGSSKNMMRLAAIRCSRCTEFWQVIQFVSLTGPLWECSKVARPESRELLDRPNDVLSLNAAPYSAARRRMCAQSRRVCARMTHLYETAIVACRPISDRSPAGG